MWRLKAAIRRRSTFGRSKKTTNEAPPPVPTKAPSTAISAAAETVFKTPELLESILVHLDQDELLHTQRVCKTWKEIISKSLPLRQMLYLSPASRIDQRIPVDNHWLKSRFPDLGIYLLQGNPKWRPKFIRALSVADFDGAGANFFASVPSASWRDMFLTQPPVKEVVVYASVDDSSRRSSVTTTKRNSSPSSLFPQLPTADELKQASILVRSKTGITMGMLFDASIEAKKRGYAAARKRNAMRMDSGYISGEEQVIDHCEFSVVEITLS